MTALCPNCKKKEIYDECGEEGLKGGGNFYRADPVGLTTYLGLDPSQETLSSFNPNVGAGAYYKASSFWFSFSIPRLFNFSEFPIPDV